MRTQVHIDGMPDGHDAARWFRRLTAAGFTFFLAKGLVWSGAAIWLVGR